LSVPSPILPGMAPMAFLLFFKRAPQAPTVIPEDRVICPKCQAYHATGHNFCVNCGWQLDRPYTPEGSTPETPAPDISTPVEQPEAAATLASEQGSGARRSRCHRIQLGGRFGASHYSGFG
jgi:hypothetical protein